MSQRDREVREAKEQKCLWSERDRGAIVTKEEEKQSIESEDKGVRKTEVRE